MTGPSREEEPGPERRSRRRRPDLSGGTEAARRFRNDAAPRQRGAIDAAHSVGSGSPEDFGGGPGTKEPPGA